VKSHFHEKVCSNREGGKGEEAGKGFSPKLKRKGEKGGGGSLGSLRKEERGR